LIAMLEEAAANAAANAECGNTGEQKADGQKEAAENTDGGNTDGQKADGQKEAAENAAANADDGNTDELIREILENKDYMAKKTFWMYGGDGWAYDIGYGGLDHVIATGRDINCFVIDTEVYSNTGGQSSKATPLGAVAQFASSGKDSGKKDLGAIMMSYGNVYVAQVAMGANPNQLIKVLKEAEEYNGPSVVVAYTPCTTHGIKAGMCNVQQEMKRAVQSGYFNLYHYDPRLEHPMKVDSPEPSLSYQDFLSGEVRYESLKGTFPERAEKLFSEAEDAAARKYKKYKKLEQQ